ncbi:zinc finger protein 800-like [Liolophura sinensis]|uniref:zinc finger protein 800-like n=1 Tax=Liolophura sinensis TaxID=3198878 RepID=UPI00315873C5
MNVEENVENVIEQYVRERQPEVDFSMITRAIKCGGSTVDQILNGIHYGTSEVRCLLLDECDIIIECKVCRSLFRSLPNFIAHKRVYCLDAFEDPTEVTIPLPQGSREDNTVVVVEPVTPEETANGDGIHSSLGNITTGEEQVGDESKVTGATNMLDKTIQQLQEGTFEGTSEAYKFYTNVVDKVERKEMERQTHFIRQETIRSNPNAVRVSIVDPSDVEDDAVQHVTHHRDPISEWLIILPMQCYPKRRSALRRQRSSSEASEGKDAEEQKGTRAKPLADDPVDTPEEPRRSMRSCGQISEKKTECSMSNTDEDSRRTRSASQRHLSPQKVDGGTKDSLSVPDRPTKAPSNPEVRKTKESKAGTSGTEVNDGDTANKVDMTDDELMQLNPSLGHRGRHFCQDSKIIDALIDENNLKCFHCGEAFANVSNIRRHVIRHLGWKRYRCKMCTYCSYNRSEMRRHLVKSHGMAVTHITETSLDFCITDLSKGASRAKANKRRQTVTNRRAASSSGISRDRSPSPKHTVGKPEVSETNIVDSTHPKHYNISTRQSPRVFDVRPFKTADAMQTLLTRKGFYPKSTKTSSSPSVSSTKTDDMRTCTSIVSEGTESRSVISDSVKRTKTKSVDFRKTRNNDNPWVDGFYKRLSGGTLGALRKEQGFHSFRKLGRSSTGTFTTSLSNSFRGGGIATRIRKPKANSIKPVNHVVSETDLGKESVSSNKHSVKTAVSACVEKTAK